MAKRLRKSTKAKGPSAQYITRAAALKRTQLRLAEFRRLCILKGIYPREPKRKLRGPNATYYHVKDIAFLNRDAVMPLFRAEKAHDKKIKKAFGRREISTARHYMRTKPTYTLQHIVKERYPTLLDAVRDLDDPLSTLALFASLPADDKNAIGSKSVAESGNLVDQFHYLVAKTGALRKVFASIKGFYFRAEILGQFVTWLVPHQYAQELPYEVDFRVMLTFQEFYRCMLKFVNFKLYSLKSLAYPPVSDRRKCQMGIRHLALSAAWLANEEDQDMTEGSTTTTTTTIASEVKSDAQRRRQQGASSDKSHRMFEGLTIFICREIPLATLSMVLVSGGATIGWDNETSPVDMEDPSITHQLVDRTPDQLESLRMFESDLPPRTFVQPQWALDCLNSDCLLPTEGYKPGVQPPPHLSPFVDDVKVGYVPKQREVLDAIIAEKKQRSVVGSLGAVNGDGAAEGEDDEVGDGEHEVDTQVMNMALAERYQQEIDRERMGQWFSHEFSTKTASQKSEVANELLTSRVEAVHGNAARRKKREAEELERRTALLSNRKRRLKSKLDDEKKQASLRAQKLHAKRKNNKEDKVESR